MPRAVKAERLLHTLAGAVEVLAILARLQYMRILRHLDHSKRTTADYIQCINMSYFAPAVMYPKNSFEFVHTTQSMHLFEINHEEKKP